ncbi:MAG TPA: sensor histidine kinase KdpD [Steroidobacteraceae bacterium]|nr:sensor histidine kinase KdpD [Steroidobacteraceae bacterium]
MTDLARRGSHRVFLGMAAGVGKTYRMLQEGQAEAEAGRDVVIGFLETHGRVDTEVQARGLELIPLRRVSYRETVLEEMDLPAILARAPELCLIDELAHTNAVGVEHAKRWQDVEDVLNAGISVFSTVNVQHLESLNDQVADLTNMRVRETIPDAVLNSADEVVLIDLTPRELIDRLKAGKIYKPDRVEAALNNFFKIENLAALREVSLRQVAEEVEAKRLVHSGPLREDLLVLTAAPQAVGERLLALITLSPQSQRVVRRAWRSAQRLGAELDLLWIVPPGELARAESTAELSAVRRLASVLGAHVLVEEGEPMIDVITRVANERGTTYILMGAPPPRNAWQRLTRPALPFQILRALPGVDLRIVADRTQRPSGDER